MDADLNEELLTKVDNEINNQTPNEKEVDSPRDDNEDAVLGEYLRNTITSDMWND